MEFNEKEKEMLKKMADAREKTIKTRRKYDEAYETYMSLVMELEQKRVQACGG